MPAVDHTPALSYSTHAIFSDTFSTFRAQTKRTLEVLEGKLKDSNDRVALLEDKLKMAAKGLVVRFTKFACAYCNAFRAKSSLLQERRIVHMMEKLILLPTHNNFSLSGFFFANAANLSINNSVTPPHPTSPNSPLS